MKYSIEQINKELPEGWECVSTSYQNLDSELIFNCPEGHQVFNTWKKIRINAECPICKQNIYKNKVADLKIIPKKKGEYRVLALDQASHITGWSIFSNQELIKYGTFETSLKDSIARDNAVKNWLIQMIHSWEPDIIGIENIQYQKDIGVTTFQALAWLQGILMECCFELGIQYELCNTNTWRHAIGVKGNHRSDQKKSMQLIVKELFDISVSDDIADSIGIGKYLSSLRKSNYEVSSWE